MTNADGSNTKPQLFRSKSKTKLKLEAYQTSEDDKFWKKSKLRKNATSNLNSNRLQITGYAVADEINIKLKLNFLDVSFEYCKKEECLCFFDHTKQQYLFLFEFGVVVFWNFSSLDEKYLLHKSERYFKNPFYDIQDVKDVMQFKSELEDISKLEDNTIFLSTEELDEKFAHSYAFAQSLKLEVFENKVSKTIKETQDIPKNLAASGIVNLSQRKVYKMIGNIFMLRSNINLLSDMLDVPDCFWDTPAWEAIYIKGRDYYDIEERIEIINNRLDLIKELYDMLNDDLHNKHTANLEWIVIGLIIVEVVVEVIWNIIIKDVLKLI